MVLVFDGHRVTRAFAHAPSGCRRDYRRHPLFDLLLARPGLNAPIRYFARLSRTVMDWPSLGPTRLALGQVAFHGGGITFFDSTLEVQPPVVAHGNVGHRLLHGVIFPTPLAVVPGNYAGH